MCQSGHDLLANRSQRAVQRLALGEKHGVKLAARCLKLGLECRQAVRPWGVLRRRRMEMSRQDVPVLQVAERDLGTSDDGCLFRRARNAEFCGNLQRVPKLLRGDSDGMQSLGHVNRAGL